MSFRELSKIIASDCDVTFERYRINCMRIYSNIMCIGLVYNDVWYMAQTF